MMNDNITGDSRIFEIAAKVDVIFEELTNNDNERKLSKEIKIVTTKIEGRTMLPPLFLMS